MLQNRTAGPLGDRTKPMVSTEKHRFKTRACSESSRRMLGSIDLRFIQHVECFTSPRSDPLGFWTDGVYTYQAVRPLQR